MVYKIAVVGTGAHPDDPSSSGYAMAYRHARGYRRLKNCELVACADIVRPNAVQFAERFDIAEEHVFEDSETMLRAIAPDIVSVCVPPAAHAEVVVSCAKSGLIRAIHCEKPIARTWGECRKMAEVCERAGVQLTINHQRRFGKPYRKAKEMLEEGTIGELNRIEVGGPDLYDYGTHLFDLCGYYTDQASAERVLASIDYRTENIQFGAHNENQALAQWEYDNGVFGLASTGSSGLVDCHMRLLGSDGVIEIGSGDGTPLRVNSQGMSNWRTVDTGTDGVYRPSESPLRTGMQTIANRVPGIPGDAFSTPSYIDRAIEDVVGAVEADRPSQLTAENALDATEIIFACWESVRRRGAVELPLEIEDNPLEAMIDSGELRPEAE
jgi:predicted dehydrogenase